MVAGALAELVVEHAVLLAPVLVLKDDVNAPVLCISDGLPATKCDPAVDFQTFGCRIIAL